MPALYVIVQPNLHGIHFKETKQGRNDVGVSVWAIPPKAPQKAVGPGRNKGGECFGPAIDGGWATENYSSWPKSSLQGLSQFTRIKETFIVAADVYDS